MEKITRYDIFTNFKWYGLPLPNILAMDFSYPVYEQREMFDAIVCDPPYGIRAGSKKTKATEENANKWIPQDKEENCGESSMGVYTEKEQYEQ
jgi:tRNA G10  N-methylase Trm11